MPKQFTILPVKTDTRGNPIAFDVADSDAHTFLIMDGSTEEMRASTRDHAQAWIAANPTGQWSGYPCPDDPDNFWIDDKTGERIPA